MLDEDKGIYIGNHGKIMELTNYENTILSLLINNKGRVVTFDEISQELYRCFADEHTINCIRYRIWALRIKFKDEFQIYTRVGYGYYII